jgi:hypothetical protein
MLGQILIYAGAVLLIFWGISHLFPTANVIRGFGPITRDNKRILMMEWIIEGVTLIFIGALVIGANYLGDGQEILIQWVNGTSFIMLIVLALISSFTGARIRFLPYQLCPVIFTISGLLIFLGTFFQ